jgi:hypothetical protein
MQQPLRLLHFFLPSREGRFFSIFFQLRMFSSETPVAGAVVQQQAISGARLINIIVKVPVFHLPFLA